MEIYVSVGNVHKRGGNVFVSRNIVLVPASFFFISILLKIELVDCWCVLIIKHAGTTPRSPVQVTLQTNKFYLMQWKVRAGESRVVVQSAACYRRPAG